MTKDRVVDVLRTLAASDKRRSQTARLRDIIDEVEAALAAGVSRATVLDALNENGFAMTPKSFESALYRIRKKQRQATASPAGRSHDEPTPPTPSTTPETRKVGSFEIPKPKRFVHTAKPDDDLLK